MYCSGELVSRIAASTATYSELRSGNLASGPEGYSRMELAVEALLGITRLFQALMITRLNRGHLLPACRADYHLELR
jgi:hypothetical protein